MEKFEIVSKVVIPFIVSLLLVAIISMGGMYYLQNSYINDNARAKLKDVSQMFSETINNDVKLFKGLIELLNKDKNIIELLENRRRDELFIYLSKIYINFKDRHNITSLAIHNTDKTNFLRMHDRNRHSDIINQKTLEKVHHTHSPTYGIEFGDTHNLILRVLYPLYNKDKLIGYIELGKEVNKLTPKLAKNLNAEIIFTINKSVINADEFESWSKKESDDSIHEVLEDFYVVDSTIDNISQGLKKVLDSKNNIVDLHFNSDNQSYHINSVPFDNLNGEEIGKLFVLLDINTEVESLIYLILKICIFIILISIVLISYYYLYIKKTENMLNEAHKKIHALSVTDGLTSLYNKRFFNDNVPFQIKRAARNNKYITLLLLDADNFKKYNDNYGHSKGDEVLKSISFTMKEVFKRGNDVCYRVGGEEFVVVFETDNLNDAIKMSQKLCKSIEKLNIEHLYNSTYNKITVSIGICTLIPTATTSLDKLYEFADKALYKSKDSGRNRVTLHKYKL